MIANRLIKNFLSLSAAGFVHSIIAVISTIYLARVLGPEGFGRVNFAFAFVQYFLILSAIGLDTVGIREVARNKDKVKEYVGSILSLKLILAFLFFLILMVAIPFLNRPKETNQLLFLYGLVLLPSALFFEWTWQGLERMGNIGASKIIRQSLYLVLLLLLVKEREDISFVPLIFLGVNIIYAVLLYLLFLKSYGHIHLNFSLENWKALLKNSIPIGITLLMGIMFYSMSTLLLGFFRSDEEVGYYNAAFQVISFMLVFITVFSDAIFPTISNLYHTSVEKMEKILSLSGKVLMLVTIPLAVGGTILAPHLMRLLFGSEYSEGVVALQVLIWISIIVSANTIYERGLLAANMQGLIMKVAIIQMMTVFILGFLLVIPFGVKGAAFATLTGQAVGLYFLHKGFISMGRLQIRKTISTPILASFIMGLFLFFCSSWNLFILIALGVLVYIIMVYLLKGITPDEMQWIMAGLPGKRKNI